MDLDVVAARKLHLLAVALALSALFLVIVVIFVFWLDATAMLDSKTLPASARREKKPLAHAVEFKISLPAAPVARASGSRPLVCFTSPVAGRRRHCHGRRPIQPLPAVAGKIE